MTYRTLPAAGQSRVATALLLAGLATLVATGGFAAERMVLAEYFTNTY